MSTVRPIIPRHISTPDNVQLNISNVDNSRIGAFSVSRITKGAEFGPFKGRRVNVRDDETVDQSYSWEVFDLQTFKYLYTVDATDPAHGNWMRYVCCARFFEEQNIVSTQNDDKVYYKALKNIEAGEELLTWFQPKKKKRKKSSQRQSIDLDSQEAIQPCQGEPRPKTPSGTMKRKRKPKIIPDSYDGPFDFEESERKEPKSVKESKEDLFEPLQPGQKRRRRKKLSDASDSTSTSKAGSPERAVNTPSEDSQLEKPLTAELTPEKDEDEENGTQSKEMESKKAGYPKTIADINDSVEWDFPDKGEEYSFELLKHHIITQSGKKVYKCDICLGLYKHMFSLKRHYLRNHINYKYLSKADMTNCLINLAQAKLNMNSMAGKSPAQLETVETREPDNTTEESKPVEEGSTIPEESKTECCDVENGINKTELHDNGLPSKDANTNCSEEREKECLNTENESESKEVTDHTDIDGNEEECTNGLNSSTNSSSSNLSSTGSEAVWKSDELMNGCENGDKSEEVMDTASDETSKTVEFPGLFQCYTCYKIFDSIPEIRSHLKDHPTKEGSVFSCSYCNMYFSFKHNLVRHQRVHTDQEKSTWSTSDRQKKDGQGQIKSRPYNRKHLLPMVKEKSEIEDKTPEIKAQPEPKDHPFPRAYKCGICPFKYDNQEALVTHVENKHKNGSKYQCKYCGKDFLSMPNMKKHVRFHLGYRATCRECNDTFTNVGSLRKHTRVAHPEVYRAKLVERLEKFGVLRGPDKNALKKKIVDKIVDNKTKTVKSDSVKEVSESKKEVPEKECSNSIDKDPDRELQADNDISFAADEIDDGGSRFKFSCTVCKKRFSSYINMCRHRRKVHSNEVKTKTEHSLACNRQTREPSPIVENPEEIAAFYANVSHNIATNLNCYIDGTPESLINFVDHIKVEGYTGNFGYSESEEKPASLTWEEYNFPQNFKPGKTVSYADIEDIGNDIDSLCTADETKFEKSFEITTNKKDSVEETLGCDNKGIGSIDTQEPTPSVDTGSTVLDKLENSENKFDVKVSRSKSPVQSEEASIPQKGTVINQKLIPIGEVEDMGIASYGMKMLSSLVTAKKAPPTENSEPGEKDGAKFFKLRIAGGMIMNTESPAARTFHQVQRGEYANFQDDLLCPETDSLLLQRKPTKPEISDESSDDELYHNECEKLNQSAQDELNSLYEEIDAELSDTPTSTCVTPKPLNFMCEQLLGISPVTKDKFRKYAQHEKITNGIASVPGKMEKVRDEPGDCVNEEKPDYSDASEDSPFFNYDSIAFGKNGKVQSVCATCKKQFKDFDMLVHHHWKRHPVTECSMLEIEQGNGIEELHFTEPSCVGALAVTDPGLEPAVDQEMFKCTFCGAVFKSVGKLHVHIVSCSPIDPVYGSHKSPAKTPLSKKLQRKFGNIFGNSKDVKAKLEFDGVSSDHIAPTTRRTGSSQKRIFTGCRKWTSVILPDSPVKEPVESDPVVQEKPTQPVVSGYNPLKHIRRRELTQVVDLLTCEGCGLKCKTIILLERHVRHCTRKEKFRTMKPLTCPIIDESVDKMKNMCFYCEKNFTYTKSLINHFQDFCPIKKAKHDKGEVTEEDKQKEATILERIQKGEEEKTAQKEKELENGTKRRITWQVGRKPKRKGNAWTLIKRKHSQQEDGEGEDNGEYNENEDETDKNMTNSDSIVEQGELSTANDKHDQGNVKVEKHSSQSWNKGANDTDGCVHVKEEIISDDSVFDKQGESESQNDSQIQDSKIKIDNVNEGQISESPGGNMNTSLNCTVRYNVNEIKPPKRGRPKNVSKGSLLFQCVADNSQEKNENADVQRRRSRASQPVAAGIVEGKRKRERVGKVEEFLRSAFSRKRKKKGQEDSMLEEEKKQDNSPNAASSAAPVVALATQVEPGKLAITSLVFLPSNNGQTMSNDGQKPLQAIRPAGTSSIENGGSNRSASISELFTTSNVEIATPSTENNNILQPQKKPRGRPRKNPTIPPATVTVSSTNSAVGGIQKQRLGRPPSKNKLKQQAVLPDNTQIDNTIENGGKADTDNTIENVGKAGICNSNLDNSCQASGTSPGKRKVLIDSSEDEQVVPEMENTNTTLVKTESRIEMEDSNQCNEDKNDSKNEVLDEFCIPDKIELDQIDSIELKSPNALTERAPSVENPHFEIKTHIENNVICTTEISVMSEQNYITSKDTGSICYSTSSISDQVSVVPTKPEMTIVKDSLAERGDINAVTDANIDTNTVTDANMDEIDGEESCSASEIVKEILMEKLFQANNSKFIGNLNERTENDDDGSDVTASTERYDSSREISPEKDYKITVQPGTCVDSMTISDIMNSQIDSLTISDRVNGESLKTDNEIDTDAVDGNVFSNEGATTAAVMKTDNSPVNTIVSKAEVREVLSKFQNSSSKEGNVRPGENEKTQDVDQRMKSDTAITPEERYTYLEKSHECVYLTNNESNKVLEDTSIHVEDQPSNIENVNSETDAGDTDEEKLVINESESVINESESEIDCKNIDNITSESESENANNTLKHGQEHDDYPVFKLALSPGERVKMNKRSCKREVDLSSPVWVKRTKQYPRLKCDKTDKYEIENSVQDKPIKPEVLDEIAKVSQMDSEANETGKVGLTKSLKSKVASNENKRISGNVGSKKCAKSNISNETNASAKAGLNKSVKLESFSGPGKGRKRKKMESSDKALDAKSKMIKQDKSSTAKHRSKR